MNTVDFIYGVYFDSAEGPDIHGNGFCINNYFVTAAHVIEEDPSVCSAPYIKLNGNKLFLDNNNLLFKKYNVQEEQSESYESSDAADIAVYKIDTISSPFKLAEDLPSCGQKLSNCFHHKQPFTSESKNTVYEHLWRTIGIVKTFVPSVPNFYIAQMKPQHPYKGSSGSPLYIDNIVYGILHSGGNDICSFFSSQKALSLIHLYEKEV